MRTREPASFWRENEAAVVTLLRVLASGRSARRSCGNNVKRFLILQTGEGLASFNKDTGLYGWKKYNKAFRDLHFWEYTKNFKAKSRTRSRSRPPIYRSLLFFCCYHVAASEPSIWNAILYTSLEWPSYKQHKQRSIHHLPTVLPMYRTEIFKTVMKYFLKHYGPQISFSFITGNLSA